MQTSFTTKYKLKYDTPLETRMKSTEEKLLMVANLSPDVDWIDRIEQVHPMKQVTIMSLVQVGVLGFMALCISLINLFVA